MLSSVVSPSNEINETETEDREREREHAKDLFRLMFFGPQLETKVDRLVSSADPDVPGEKG